MKKILIIFCLLSVLTGCGVPELSYNGNELVYTCTEEDISLFKDDIIVNITDRQSFVISDVNSVVKEYTNGILEYNDENRIDAKSCYFVSYEEIVGNKFASRTAISHRDPIEGGMRLSVSGNYSFKVTNAKMFLETYTTLEQLNNYINTNITSVYIMNMQSKTFNELVNETEFDEVKLQSVNSLLSKYGIEVTKVNIEVVKKIE